MRYYKELWIERTGLFLFLILFASSGWAQTLTGTILGTITDPSGAVVPGVEVTVINTGTNQTRSVTTTGSGTYSLSNLPVGSYRLEASQQGFRTEARIGIVLQIDQSARFDITLQVGAINQVVEVVAVTPLLQTDESSIGSVIDVQKITQLPLNGRKFETLVQLVPGAVTPAQGSEIGTRGGFSIGGFDEGGNSFILDGIDNVDPVLRKFSFRPSIDLIQEFKVEQNSFSAEFGRNAGAVINVTTKSGTNTLHGSAWEFLRNDNLDARNFFAAPGTPKQDLIRNQFGAALGGPVVGDRTFFFVAYEGLRAKEGESNRASVPTLKMRAGDFSELATSIIDPATGAAFPGNIILQDRMVAVTRDVIQAYPVPNIAGAGLTQNRSETANRVENADDISVRIDHHLLENTDLMGRYSFSNTRFSDPFRTEGSPTPTSLKDFGQSVDAISTSAGLNFTTFFGSNVIHEFRVGYSRFKQPQLPAQGLPSNQAAVAGFVKAFLRFSPSGYESIGSGREFFRVVNVYNYIDQVSWQTGNHSFKFGLDVRRYLFNASSALPNEFAFASVPGLGTGNSLADMFLGLPQTTTSNGGDPYGNTKKTEVAWYVQDDWKVTPYLTLNYGLRWDWYGRITESIDKQAYWNLDCNCMLIAGQDGTSRGLVDDDWNNFAPRFGFALRPFGDDSTVIRAGGGIFYDSEMRHNFSFVTNPPFFDQTRYNRSAAVPLTMDDPFQTNATVPPSPFSIRFGMPKEYRDTYAEHWNLSVQREVLSDTVLDVSYVGNHVVKAQRLRNLNQFVLGGGPPLAGSFFSLMFEQGGSSTYHALQVRAERRFSDGLTFISSYTWGHAIDDRNGEGDASTGPLGIAGIQNAHDVSKEKASADYDVRHRYTLSYIYDLPDPNYEGVIVKSGV